MDDDLTIPGFARNAGASEITIRRRVLAGAIRARKVLGRWRIPRAELARFLAAGGAASPERAAPPDRTRSTGAA